MTQEQGAQETKARKITDPEEWLRDRVAYLKGVKNKSEAQELLVLLFGKAGRTDQEDRKLVALVKAEKAAVKAAKARTAAIKLIQDDKRKAAEAERKARNHEMFMAAGLLSLAGFVDKKTGKPTRDRGEILGALLALSKTTDPQRWASWKQTGDALLAQKGEELTKEAA